MFNGFFCGTQNSNFFPHAPSHSPMVLSCRLGSLRSLSSNSLAAQGEDDDYDDVSDRGRAELFWDAWNRVLVQHGPMSPKFLFFLGKSWSQKTKKISKASKNRVVVMVDVSNPSARDGPWDGHAHDWRAHARPRTGSLEGAGMVEPCWAINTYAGGYTSLDSWGLMI